MPQVKINGLWVDLLSQGNGKFTAAGRQFTAAQPKKKKKTIYKKYPLSSAYHPEDVAKVIELPFQAVSKALNFILGENNAQKVGLGLSYLMPSRYIGWVKSGYMPHDPRNPGIENGRPEELGLNLLTDLVLTPTTAKVGREATSAIGNAVSKTLPYKAWQISRAIDNIGLPSLEVSNKPLATVFQRPKNYYTPTPYNLSRKRPFDMLPIKETPFQAYSNIQGPFIYDEFGTFIPNKNYHFRRGWGIIDDAVNTGRIRVPEGNYKAEALKKYPWLDNGNPLSTALLNHTFPYFSEGQLWGAMGKFGVEPTDLIVASNNIPGVQWVAGSKYGSLLKDVKPSTKGGRSTPLINGEPNALPTNKTLLYRLNPRTRRYEPYNVSVENIDILLERPSRISEAERFGIPKGERNFTPKWHVANYPGYQLKILMGGNPLERLLSKNGTININSLMAQVNKASEVEKAVINKVLEEKFNGQKVIDYNALKKAVLDELITYSRKPLTRYNDYGIDRLGFKKDIIPADATVGDLENMYPGRFQTVIRPSFRMVDTKTGRIVTNNAELLELVKVLNDEKPYKLNTFTFESPRITIGSNKHYDATSLGHSRTFTLKDLPKKLYVLESLSDWGLSKVKMLPSALAMLIAIDRAIQSGNTNAFHGFTNKLHSVLRNNLTKYEQMALDNINIEIESGHPSGFLTIDLLWNKKYEILKKASKRANLEEQGLYLHDNYLQRQLQENLKFAAENKQTTVSYPTPETAAKIEGYLTKELWYNPEGLKANLMDLTYNFETGHFEMPKGYYSKIEYAPEHQTILKKYSDFPRLFNRLYKYLNVRTVTDAKGNTWYEIDVPKGYLNREWQFKQGGKINKYQYGNPIIKYVDSYRVNPETGGVYDDVGDIKEGAVILPEVLITKPKKSFLESTINYINKGLTLPIRGIIFTNNFISNLFNNNEDTYLNATVPFGLGPGHERDNIINISNGVSGLMNLLGMMGAIRGEDGIYRFRNSNNNLQGTKLNKANSNLEFLKWCAENANLINRYYKRPTAGDAWTRHGIYGDSAIVVAPYKRKNYTRNVNPYRVMAKDQAYYVQKNIDNDGINLISGDIVDMFYPGSNFQDRAVQEGDENRVNTHTGTIIRTGPKKENTYVIHSMGNGLIIDPIGNLLGPRLKDPFITGIRRPYRKP